MFIEERHQKIADLINENGKITISEISALFEISDESARRDLRILEQKGVCKRTHGGAIRPKQIGIKPPIDRVFTDMPIYENYRRIAQKAVEMINEKDTLFITSGSFGHIMSKLLPFDIQLTIVVNHVELACDFRKFDNIDVYVAGGKMRKSGSIVDTLSNDFISRMHFDKCFLTGSGLTADNGLSNGTDETASFQRSVIKNSRNRYLLMPGVKIGNDAFIKVCGADQFDFVMTDEDCNEEHIAQLEDIGVKVLVV